MSNLADHKFPRPRFARSINVERDAGTNAIDGYLPVGRAMDAIAHLAQALDRDDVEVAISITGPYGSGKSSLAIVLDALLGPKGDPIRVSAEEILAHVAPAALRRLESARTRLNADQCGFIRATVTAQREPISTTVLRALIHGAERFSAPERSKARLGKTMKTVRSMYAATNGAISSRPDTRSIRKVIADLGTIAPVFILIDEFGKNLEAFADSRSDADLFLLQELAEWTRGDNGFPLALVTLQHMAFDEYADTTTAAHRREWAKIQGRFEDIPFVDSPAQTRTLIGAAFDPPTSELAAAQEKWAAGEAKELTRIGLTDLASDRDLLGACWPIHPTALAALPELCERYGQNERTLFSFLAGNDPRSISAFLEETSWKPGAPLPVVRLDRLYDYFLETAASLVAVSRNASRWLEIDTRIRDAIGLAEAPRRVLKIIGLLNLVSAGGTLRASKAIVCYAAADGQDGTRNSKQVEARLKELEVAGLVTFRDFADEFRVWHGSDFDLRSAVDLARRRFRDEPSAEILRRVLPLMPLVAARHSHKAGTLRAFDRAWVTIAEKSIEPLGNSDRADGLVLYVLGPDAPTAAISRRPDAKPSVFVTTADANPLIDAAKEVAALNEIIESDGGLVDDWVARRELLERQVEAFEALDREFHIAYSGNTAIWRTVKPDKGSHWTRNQSSTASVVISNVCDQWYGQAPIMKNDLVNRHELSSQAARARRVVIESMIAGSHQENLGIQGFGPDKTLYLSVLADHGLHGRANDGTWEFMAPDATSSARPLWEKTETLLQAATAERLRVDDLYAQLSAPPYGLRPGVAPVLLVAALLVGAEDVAIYEHGTFKPVLADDILERLLRNPGNFELKHYASRTGTRAKFLTLLADALDIQARRGNRNGRVGSVLAVVSHLVALANTLPEHVKKTQYLSSDTRNILKALVLATEPDELLFTKLPEALGMKPVTATGRYAESELADIADRVAIACSELQQAFATLLKKIGAALQKDVGSGCDPLREGLAARANELKGKMINPQVSKLIVALTADIPDLDSWLTYVAMNVTGVPPEAWTDNDRQRFFVTLADVGGTFRRIYALNANLDARGDGFDAFRHVITRSDGDEIVRVVTIDEAIRDAGQPVLNDAIAGLAKTLGISHAETRSVLMGLLGEADFAAIQSESTEHVLGPAYSDRERLATEG